MKSGSSDLPNTPQELWELFPSLITTLYSRPNEGWAPKEINVDLSCSYTGFHSVCVFAGRSKLRLSRQVLITLPKPQSSARKEPFLGGCWLLQQSPTGKQTPPGFSKPTPVNFWTEMKVSGVYFNFINKGQNSILPLHAEHKCRYNKLQYPPLCYTMVAVYYHPKLITLASFSKKNPRSCELQELFFTCQAKS